MLKVTSGIYAITNTITNSLYIGSSKNIAKRLQTHERLLLRGTHPNKHLQNAVNKYGIENFLFQTIYAVDCKRNELLLYEKLFTLSESPDKLYNIFCPLTFYSESYNYGEFIDRRVKSWKETVDRNGGLPAWTEDRKRHQSLAVSGEKNGFYGKRHDEATLALLSEKAKQRWSNIEERRKQSERRKKYFEDPAARERVGNSSRGRKQPVEQNRIKSERNSGSGNPNAKPILFEGVRYGCLKEASTALGISIYKLKKLLKPNDYLERE